MKKINYLETKGDPLDMRIIRGPTGRGMGDTFLEKYTEVDLEFIKDKQTKKLLVTKYVNHYDEDPKVSKRAKRGSTFQAYSKET